MSKESINALKRIGAKLIDQSDQLNEIVKIIPEQSRKLKAYGEYIDYVADEYDRLYSLGVNCDLTQVVDFDAIDQSMSWQLPTSTQLFATTATVSGELTSITQPMLPYIDQESDYGFLGHPPESFRLLMSTDEMVNKLNTISPGLGITWKNAWDSFAVGDVNSIKSTATSARTVMDELSWQAPYDHLAKLSWCQFDQKSKPTRASRFAWLLHGDNLPEDIENDPTNDKLWKSFNKNYNALQKYVHISQVKQSDIVHIEIILMALEECLEVGKVIAKINSISPQNI